MRKTSMAKLRTCTAASVLAAIVGFASPAAASCTGIHLFSGALNEKRLELLHEVAQRADIRFGVFCMIEPVGSASALVAFGAAAAGALAASGSTPCISG